jgi:hypothetical protein
VPTTVLLYMCMYCYQVLVRVWVSIS